MIQEIKEIYTQASSAYENGQHDHAVDLFTYLIFQDPTQAAFWQGLAAARQVQRHYKEALMAWAMASHQNPTDPVPHFHAAQCYICQGEMDEAVKELDLALALPCTENVIEKIEVIKEVIAHG